MQAFPTGPTVTDHPAILERGHLWLLETVDGLPLRFRVEDSGLCVFGDADRTFSEPPPAYRAATTHVQERLDREALRAAAEDLPGVTFFGVATARRSVTYDWGRLPPFLGTDIHSRHRGTSLPPDGVEQAYTGIGLTPVNALQKEVRAADFHPDTYDFPPSAWYDGPVAGVLLKNKTGDRARLSNPAVSTPPDVVEVEADPTALADRWATRDRITRVREELLSRGVATDPETLTERVVDAIHREEYWTITHAGRPIDTPAFRSAVGARVRTVLTDHS